MLALMLLLAADAEPTAPDGFTSLFNGKDFSGWKAHGGKIDKWSVDTEAKTIHTGKGGGGWLMTEKEYGDFELRLEFKVPKGGNSGVALRSPMKGDPAYTGMEIQILDDKGHGKLEKWQHTGSIYGVVAASSVPTKPLGEWNKYKIT
ncbi:MAG: DUF1080 domain-containing protein, partial [Gemmataceae bacterium]|nr:DUF1080 domain-containing protein [Gemmataceae bacterium]